MSRPGPAPRLASVSVAALACSLGLSACVSAKEYAALEAEVAKTRAELSDARSEAKELGVALEEVQNAIDVLNADIEDVAQALVIAEARASDAEAQLAAVNSDKEGLESSIAQMEAALAELERLKAKAEVRAGLYRAVLAKFKALIDGGKLKVKVVDGRLIVELKTDILFASGSADLSDEGAATIREVGGVLASIEDRTFQVEGHTDNVPIKTAKYPSNWELASARAVNVVKEMVDAGMPKTRVSAAAFAATRPAATNETDEGRAQNRRIEIVIVPDLSDLPGMAEIEKMFSR